MLLSEWELWACANRLVELHGDEAPIFAAMRIDALTDADDEAGAANWRAILARVENLMALPVSALS
mgnify:CR=1 FL=1